MKQKKEYDMKKKNIENMKKFFLLIMLLSLQIVVWSQSPVQEEFEKFVNRFYPIVNYPFVVSEDYEKMTKVKAGLRSIDENLLKIFVYGQGIKPAAVACDLEDFITYKAYIQFSTTDSVFLLSIAPEMMDPACRSGILLATYSKYNYQLQDTLWISLEGALEPQHIDGNQVVCNLLIESTLTEDSICMTRTESHYLRTRGKPSQKIKVTIYNTMYKMTVGGKFIMMKDEKKDEILDPIADKLKETQRIVR